ncbi:toprim domain-containing protein [Rubellimicrobium sp. CFH 75288]|uniref:DUF7146 domain-containing protein n=1 Tax=Rubellimicrobium sp. CFH 75288 TaxID=2697034 RepID=UPI001411B47E|nr:toprim domain-containing protein [Rubellimicrobium sp. CFH 75288]NAZ38158.1 hypothetical protein [Rubellimicrobium sp. CFH 75288]
MTDARSLTLALKGRWFGRYGLACCPAHGDRHPSLSLSDETKGRVLSRCHTGCGFRDILKALRDLGLAEGTGRVLELDAIAPTRREAEERAIAQRRSLQATFTWKAALPIGGTLAETYLRGRGITCALPPSLRFHPAAWHPTGTRFPALVALVEGGEWAAVHRTYLRPDGSGKVGVQPTKAMLGNVRGGAVRLAEAPGPLVVAEGIETALSLASGLLPSPATVWAALSASGFLALRLPPDPGELIVATDGDRAGRKVGDALARSATRMVWSVSLLPAPEGRDWNDILQDMRAP